VTLPRRSHIVCSGTRPACGSFTGVSAHEPNPVGPAWAVVLKQPYQLAGEVVPMSSTRETRSQWVLVAVALTLGSVLAACGGSAVRPNPGQSSGSATSQFYVSVGDSYAAGYQPTAPRVGRPTTDGFAYQLVPSARQKGYNLQLVNFGCVSATSESIAHQPGCKPKNRSPGGPAYDNQPQADAAEAFLRQHQGRVGLVTVVIGGNDITPCIRQPQPIPCVAAAVKTIGANVGPLVQALRAAAGPNVPIVGITYPDVILGLFTLPSPALRQRAQLSVPAFKSVINPILKSAYESAGGKFVDVTAATGAYAPLTPTVNFPPYGQLPEPAAKICTLTYFCQYTDIHPTPDGHKTIASLVVAALPPAH
jgi:lysophospholipase L1-like esterase